MALPTQAIQNEMERFKRLTQEFRQRVGGDDTKVGESDEEREQVYQILVQINEFLEDKLRRAP
ncbi:MAG: hypothetical protein KY455_07125 [Euryarchaeota archaeon]|nr:hypothetical protein [Euryarchaeota archaeon]